MYICDMRLLYFIFCSIFLFSCNSKKESISKNIISEEKIIPIIADIEKAQAFVMRFPDSTSTSSQRQSAYFKEIFKKYNVSETDYNNSIKYYTSKPEELEKIMDRVSQKISKDAR